MGLRCAWRYVALLTMLGALFSGPAAAFNQAELEVVPVPFAPGNLDLPYPVHEYARISLKAILRGATCSSGYDVVWDADRDGNFDNDTSRQVLPTAGTATVYDIGRTFEVPAVSRSTTMTLNVRARSKCNASDEVYGTYRIYVYNWAPSSDPNKWTKDQLEVMSTIAIHEGLWWLHRDNTVFGGTGSIIWGRNNRTYGGWRYQAAGAFAAMWAMSANGRQPAYPPGTLEEHGHTISPDWYAANDERWLSDPYAETMIRWVNFVTGVNNGIHGRSDRADIRNVDEANTCGWNEDGTEKLCEPIPGTDNGMGALVTYTWGTYDNGLGLGALATLLPTLAGTPLQEGHYNADITMKGRLWEAFIQEAVDWLGYMQIDRGCAMGGWLYGDRGNNADGPCSHMDASTAQWAYIGLESADVAGKPYGVIVNNRHKYRIIENLFQNKNPFGASMYRSSYRGWTSRHDFHLTGGAFVAARWAGLHNMEPNDERPFAPYTNRTQREMVDMYNQIVQYTATYWNTPNMRGVHWAAGLWQTGEHLCGTPQGVYNAPNCGHTYAMYSHQKGYRTGTPELLDVGGHDWVREFSTYFVRAQSMHLNNYTDFGRFVDRHMYGHSVGARVGPNLNSGWAILTLTPSIFKPKPVPLAEVRPNEVIEGCAGGNNGLVQFDHGASFHPNSQAEIARFQWDVDDSDGLWWETGAPVDFESNNKSVVFTHRYMRPGIFKATLRVVDNDISEPLTESTTVSVQVNSAPPSAPGALAGGPYWVENNGEVTLSGASATDANLSCGDTLTYAWDLDDDGEFDDADVLNPLVSHALYEEVMDWEESVTIRLKVTDSTGRSTIAISSMTKYRKHPIARAVINPNPAACRETIRLDASDSYHQNPNRRVVSYAWDMAGDDAFEIVTEQPESAYSYTAFGTYPGRLKITDNVGGSRIRSFEVVVSEGNQRPTAITSQPVYHVTDGDDLALDGRASFDPNGNCGDSIVEYAWDVNGNGNFNDPVDARGATTVIPWAVLSTMNWPADRNTGLPVNPISLRVTDSLGLTHTTHSGVSIYQTRPVAVVFQSPTVAAMAADNGVSNFTLDGRASHSPIPGVDIVRYDWDLNDDGTFEIQNQPVHEAQLVFWPLPDVAPQPYIRLRVTDAAGRTNITRQMLLVALPGETPPTAVANPDEAVGGDNVGGRDNGEDDPSGYHAVGGGDPTVTLDADAPLDEAGKPRVYRWDLDGDGEWDIEQIDEDGDGAEAELSLTPEQRAQYGLDQPGAHEITVQVETDRGHITETTYHHIIDDAEDGVQVDIDQIIERDAEDPPAVYRWDLDGDGVFDIEQADENGDGAESVLNLTPEQAAQYGLDQDGTHEIIVEVETVSGETTRATVVHSAPEEDGGVSVDVTEVATPDNDAPATVYRWDLDGDGEFDVEQVDENGDGVESELKLTPEQTAEYGLDQPGAHEITVERENGRGQTETTTYTHVVDAPDSSLSLDAETVVEIDPENPPTVYRWDLDGDGEFDVEQVDEDGDGAEATLVLTLDQQAQYGLDQNGAHQISVQTETADGQQRTVTYVQWVGDPEEGMNLDADDVVDRNPADPPVLYRWDLDGDGTFDVEQADPELEITDEMAREYGLDHTGEQEITIEVVTASGNRTTGKVVVSVDAPENGVVIDTPSVVDPEDAGPLTIYRWDLDGDGEWDIVRVDEDGDGAEAILALTPEQAERYGLDTEGSHTITVQVENADGQQTNSSFTQHVDDGDDGMQIDSRDVIDHNPAPSTRYRWDLDGDGDYDVEQRDDNGDGAEATLVLTPEQVVEFGLDKPGSHEVGLQIVYPNGSTGTGTVLYHVESEGESVELDTGDIVPPDAEDPPAFYRWDLDADGVWDIERADENGDGAEGELTLTPDIKALYGLDRKGSHSIIVEVETASGARTQRTIVHHEEGIEEIELDASESFDPDAEDRIRYYRWDLNGDGEWDIVAEDADGDGAEAVLKIPAALAEQLGLDKPGDYEFTLEVESESGQTAQSTTTLTVYPRDPTVSVTANPSPAACNGQVVLDASEAEHAHPDVDVVSWRWDLDGDGVYDDGVGEVLTTRFGQFTFGGPLTVGVEVEDSAGHRARATTTVVVSEGNRAPVPEAGQYVVPYGGSVALDGSASADPDASCGDSILRYQWDLDGDGSSDVQGAQFNVSAAQLAGFGMGAPGEYEVTLEVVDRFGRTATDRARIWLVGTPTAQAQASKASASCNEQVSFTGANSTHDGPEGDGRFAIEEYRWDMDGDGIFERSGETVLDAVVAEDSVTATLMVIDALGRTDTDTVTVAVNVANVRPVADAGGPYITAQVDGTFAGVDLDARGSLEPNAPCDHIQTYAWDTDNDGLYGADDVDGAGALVGSDYVGAQVQGYINPGWRTGTTQVVRLKALDVFGLWSEPAEAEIRVRSKLPPLGEILWPRGGDCVPEDADPFQVSVRQPDGGEVTLTAKVGGVEVGSTVVNLPADGSAVSADIDVDTTLAPEGMAAVTVVLLDDEGQESVVNSGGQVAFDRTGPVIAINAALTEGACYAEGQVPGLELQVSDALDPAPAVEQGVSAEACIRTLDIAATDACGNRSTLQRSWLMAEQAEPEIVGPANGDVVSSATYTWSLDVPAQCVASESATMNLDGATAFPYVEGARVQAAGLYRFDLLLSDCRGVPYGRQRTFRINAPPVAMTGGSYQGSEGRVIVLNGGQSQSPEAEDFIALYEWDMDRDGEYEFAGETINFVASDAGRITGRLRVTDSFGASDTAAVVVDVIEVDPIVDAGGPYKVPQGHVVEFDARGSRPGSPTDLLTRFDWDFGDGTTLSGNTLTQPRHTYAQNGVYNVRLTVHDEDTSTSVIVPVIVLDALPQLSDIEAPEDPYEITALTFSITANAGGVDDPIESYTWDFGDGSEPVTGAELSSVQHAWRDAGTYTVTVTVSDGDSVGIQSVEVQVREATMAELLTEVDARLEANDDGPLVAQALEAIEPWMDMAMWGEANGKGGNTMLAVKQIVSILVNAMALGAELDDTLYLIMRQAERKVLAERARLVGDDADQFPADHPSVAQADVYLGLTEDMMKGDNIEATLSNPLQAFMANDISLSLNEAWFYLADAAHPCKATKYNNFEIPFVRDLIERASAAQAINEDLNEAVALLALELQQYAELGLDAPGRAEVLNALQDLRAIQAQLATPVGLECEDNNCISDRDALELLVQLMNLSTELTAAANEGAYVRNWQACLVEGVKFRTALSEMRLEYVCGPFSPVTLRARVTRANGLRLVDEESDVVAALDYFQARSTRCLAVWAYNSCLVPAFPNLNASYPNPEYCEDDGTAAQAGGDGQAPGD
ncbi:MAG: PKD domain-containing protein [Bradymonadia bacterium]